MTKSSADEYGTVSYQLPAEAHAMVRLLVRCASPVPTPQELRTLRCLFPELADESIEALRARLEATPLLTFGPFGVAISESDLVDEARAAGLVVEVEPIEQDVAPRSETDWLEPWLPLAGEQSAQLAAELKREITTGHVLCGRRVRAVARRSDCDDVLFGFLDGPSVAVVHLTWASSSDALSPRTAIFDSFESFALERMRADHAEFSGEDPVK